MAQDKWIKCLAQGGNIHATVIVAKDFINEARKKHGLGKLETKTLGEAMLAGLLLSSTMKEGERLSLSIKGDHVLKQVVVDIDPYHFFEDGIAASTRGFLITREVTVDNDPSRGPWQNGLLTVVRLKLDQKEPYVGTVPVVTGHVAKDVTFYLSQSEQIPSALGVSVNLNDEGEVASAGGFIAQVMPGALPAEIKILDMNLQSMERFETQLAAGAGPTKILENIFTDMSFTETEERPIRFFCECTRARVMNAIMLLGKTEILDMIEKDNGAEVRCDFCSTNYKFNIDELEALIPERN